jgi:hypothetical protein
VISEALEHLDALIVGVVDVDPHPDRPPELGSTAPGDQAQHGDDGLVAGQEVMCRARGALGAASRDLGAVSRDAAGDLDAVASLLVCHGAQASDSDHLQALSEAELVVVGSWTDGLLLFGQRPGRLGRLVKMPVIDGKKAAVYCTYAISSGKTLEQLAGVVSRRGGDVVGGSAIKRSNLAGGASDLVDRLLGSLDTTVSGAA